MKHNTNESFISSNSQVPITTIETVENVSDYYTSTPRNKPVSKQNQSNTSLPASLQSILTQQTLKPVGEIPKFFIQAPKPGQKPPKRQEVVSYELGGNAIELQTPNYAKAYEGKLKHVVRMANGDPLPSFIRAKVTQGNRRVIRIHQED